MILFVAVAAATDVVIAVALMKFDSSPDLIVKKYPFFMHQCMIYVSPFFIPCVCVWVCY